MPRLILWDIDGTLMRGNGDIPHQFLQAMREVYGLPDEIKRVDYGGKTDGQIVLETLALHEVDEAAAHSGMPQFSARYHALVDEIAHELHRSLRVLPGVIPVLQRLREHGALQTLLTGNLAPVAALKLRALDLDGYFDLEIGAYGSDHHVRTELVPIARRKAAARYADVGDVVVIGDTLRDIACGKAGAARTVAVATGNVSAAELAAHAPDALLRDLSDTDAAVAAILG